MSLRIPSPSSAFGLMAAVLLSACGGAGGAGGTATGFIGGQPGQVCNPKYNDEGCTTVTGGGFQRVKCDATDPAKPVWAPLAPCATGESCREVAQTTPANTPMKTAECYLYQAATPTGTADATGSGDTTTGGDTKISGDIGSATMDGSAIMACAKSKCASLYSACLLDAKCKATATCTEKCKDVACMMACPQDSSPAGSTLSACIQTQKCVPALGVCGDGMCVGPNETNANCPADCKATGTAKCGDLNCSSPETPSSCPLDCDPANAQTISCLESMCGPSLTACINNKDCTTFLGCAAPCKANASCQSACAAKAPASAQSIISALGTCANGAKCLGGSTTGPVCGNGTCESGETPSSCPQDCKTTSAKCGDMKCSSGEKCPVDCNTKYMGTLMCFQQGCGSQYSACTNDAACLGFFNCNVACNCDKNCESSCQEMTGSPNPTLSALMECVSGLSCSDPCPASGPVCGNNKCESGETVSSCPTDCKAPSTVCGNGTCESGETATSCPSDCGSSTGAKGCAADGASKGGCGSCACEACVCAADSWCCSTGWDSACASACVKCPGSGCAP